MTHPLKAWIKSRQMSVTEFCDGQPFSYVTVYKLLKGEGDFRSATLEAISAATQNEVSTETLLAVLKAQREQAAQPKTSEEAA